MLFLFQHKMVRQYYARLNLRFTSYEIGADQIKLSGENMPWKGELQIKMPNNKWGSVCWQFWEVNTNNVICKTLRYR